MKVYAALLDGDAVARWMVPDGMTSHVHAFEGSEGGRFRISLTYDPGQDGAGKTTTETDTFGGRFVKLVPGEVVVQEVEFETEDPSLRGVMTITFALHEADGGTDLVATHTGLPPGVRPEDNEIGWRMSLDKLAVLVAGG